MASRGEGLAVDGVSGVLIPIKANTGAAGFSQTSG